MTITLSDVGSGYKRTAINSNFQAIESEINNNLLSKNGGVGLEADLDANSQKVINLADGILASDAVNLSQLQGAISAASSGLIASQTEVQLGSAAVANVFTFTGITYTVGGNNLYVFRNGQKLGKGEDYTETSSSSITLTFTPNDSDRFEFITNLATTNSTTDTSAITHTESGTDYNLATYLQNRHVVNVKDFGAVGDGVTDDTAAINAAFDFARANTGTNQGHKIYFPRGTYLISSTVDIYMPVATGCVIEGDGYNVTVLKWTGTSGEMLSNEQATSNKFQYGLFIRDMTLTASTSRPAGSVGLHLEMLQNKAKLERVVIFNFELGLFVGLHAEMLSVENCFIAYNTYGAYGQGDQTDVLTFRSTTFSYNELRALKLSSPRAVVTDCHFNEGQISDTANYRDIQLGYSAIRAEDIGKSAYATADKGNDGSRTRFLNNSFEGIGDKAAVLFEDFDSRVGIPGGNITFENNKAALYDRPAFLEVINPYFNVKFEGTQISATSEDTCLINDVNTVTGSYVINEPYISKVWATTEQYLRNGIDKEFFDGLYQYGCSLQHSVDWLIDKTTGITLVDMDVDGEGLLEISYDEATFTGTPSVRFYNNNCPAGYVYFMLPVRKLGGSLFLEFEVKTGGGTTLHYSKGHQVSEDNKYYVFGFNNPTVQSISLRIYPKPYSNDASSWLMDFPLVKHFNNEMESFTLVDTSANKLFTNRSGQVFELVPKIPHLDVIDVANKATGAWFFSQPKTSVMGAPATSGDTSINVTNASTIFSIGEYLHFKAPAVSGVSKAHNGSITTGNKISNIVGDTVTLATGVPFNVDSGSSVVGCEVYQQAASTKL